MATPSWKSSLLELSPELKDVVSQDAFTVSELSNRGLIKVHGEDAETFLQNLLTNDIRKVTEATHQPSAWCSPKGRIIATFRIFKRPDGYYLSLAADLIEHVIKKMGMYVMMSKVTLEDVTDTMAHIGISGEITESTLPAFLEDISLPAEINQTTTNEAISILRIPGTTPRFEVLGEPQAIHSLWSHCLNQVATPAHSTHWDYLNILAGLPVISKASSEAWIPQMVNYIAIGGVDFKKGCYPGQEVVARLNYLGKTKRRMYHLLIDTHDLPAINDPVATDADAAAGKILNAVINPEGRAEALAILKISEVEKPLYLPVENEPSVALLDLPYSLDED